MRCTPQQLEKQMENSQIERAAVAAVQSPTVSLKTLVEALSVLRAVHALSSSEVVPVSVLIAASLASCTLGHYVDRMLAAQQVGVTA